MRSRKKIILDGAIRGLAVWLAYGVAEFALAVAIPALWSNESELLPWQWPLIGLLFCVYAVAGLVLGAAGGAWLGRKQRRPSADDHKNLAGLILSLAFALNLAVGWPLARSEYLALALACLLGAMFCAALRSAAWRRRMAMLAPPGILSLLLLIGPWVSREAMPDSAGWVKTAASLLAMAAVVALAALGRRLLPVRPASKAWTAAAGVLLVAVLATRIHGLGLAADTVAPSRPGAPERPNVLLVTMDTVRASHVSVYGYGRDTTPQLRKFAGEATVYERAIASDGFTLPTHASIFTGLYSSWHGATVRPGHPYGAALPPRSRTLAGTLRAHGYWTAEAVANYGFLGPGLGLAQGFAVTEANMAAHLADVNRPFYLREGALKLLSLGGSTAEFLQYSLRAPDVNRHAFALFEEARHSRQPFFIFLNYMDAHAPYLPPPPFAERFAAAGHEQPIRGEDYMAVRDAVNSRQRVLTQGEKEYLASQYDGGIAALDDGLGKLLQRLRDLNLYDNTLIVITADHGEALGEHNRLEHGMGSVYEDQVHVPLLIKYPGQHQARQSAVLVSQVDLMPTVLDWAGIAIPGMLQGRSLRSADTWEPRDIFAEGEGRGRSQNLNPQLRGSRRAIFSGRWKLIEWSAGPPELYDPAADPGELHNLYRPGDPEAAALLARIAAFKAAAPRPDASVSRKPADKQSLEKLRSLGYIQ